MAEYAPGIYHLNVTDVGFGTSKNNNPQIIIVGKVVAFIDESDPPNRTACAVHKSYERTIKLTVSNSEDSKKYAMMKLREAGFDGDNFADLPGALIGSTIEATCDEEKGAGDHAGKVFEKWDLPLPTKQSEPLQKRPEVAMTLNNLFGSELKQGAKPKAKQAKKQPASVPPDEQFEQPPGDGDPGYVPDDEIPF